MKTAVLTLISIITFSAYSHAQSDSADYFFNRGQEERAAGRVLPAYQDFQKAARLKPNDANYLRLAGLSAVDLHKYEFARQHFQQLYQLDKNDTTAIIQLAEINFALRKWNDAINFAEMMQQKRLGHRYN